MFYLAFSFVGFQDQCSSNKREHGQLSRSRYVSMATREGVTVATEGQATQRFEDVADNISKIGQWKLKIVRGELLVLSVCVF